MGFEDGCAFIWRFEVQVMSVSTIDSDRYQYIGK